MGLKIKWTSVIWYGLKKVKGQVPYGMGLKEKRQVSYGMDL